jgi:superfamily II DNA or RNA helicase
VPSCAAPPIIVAEALVAVPDPLATGLRLPLCSSAEAVAASIARSLAPAEDGSAAPTWLLPEQHQSFRRALAALRRYGGAVLADPVGSGKTYVALAVAKALNRGSTTACLVPATLTAKWKQAAEQLGIPVRVESHEQVSHGRLPNGTSGLVVVDESHHFRNRHTKRYDKLARWLVGRTALLVTATPIVNRLDDLAHQLWLTVRDNALAPEGIASLRSSLASGCIDPALGRLVLERELAGEGRPVRNLRVAGATLQEAAAATDALYALRRLRLSNNGGVAELVRGVLLRAAASSPAALLGALRRYRRLLLHARDALQAGRPMARSELRRFTADLGDQLVWWELLPSEGGLGDLELGDLDELEGQIRSVAAAAEQPDGKLNRLRQILQDARCTLVFTCSRDTVRYLREQLNTPGIAWCTGDSAGIGSAILPRAEVLRWFRQKRVDTRAPTHLIVTDVAAEGLDLQRAARVVHYDLPWTPMRLEQREGRAVRLGSQHREIDVVRFGAPSVVEQSLGMEATLSRKATLPASAGLGPCGRHIWRWRSDLAKEFRAVEPFAGTAAVYSERAGILGGFTLYSAREPGFRLCASVMWMDADGWTESHPIVTERLRAAATSRIVSLPDREIRGALALLAEPIKHRLAAARRRQWLCPDADTGTRKLGARLHHLIGQAARMRQSERLVRLEHALGFVAGGHTAGESLLIEQLANQHSDHEVERALSRMPSRTEWDDLDVRLTGLLIFRGGS